MECVDTIQTKLGRQREKSMKEERAWLDKVFANTDATEQMTAEIIDGGHFNAAPTEIITSINVEINLASVALNVDASRSSLTQILHL
eukprot:2413233-Ditylum_brightwellii.AAC.2